MKCSEENVPQYLDEIDDLVSEDKHNTCVREAAKKKFFF